MTTTSYNPFVGDVEPAIYKRRGSFNYGGTISSDDCVIFFDANYGGDGNWYQYVGSNPLPFNVQPGSTPDSNWKSVNNAVIMDLVEEKLNQITSTLSSSTGAESIGVAEGGTVQDSVVFTTPESKGAVGDGVSDDTDAVKNSLYRNTFLKAKIYKITTQITIPDNSCILSRGSLVYNLASSALLPGNNFKYSGGEINNTASGQALFADSKSNISVSDVKAKGSNVRTGTHAYAFNVRKCSNVRLRNIDAFTYTGVVYIDNSSNVSVRDVFTNDTVYHKSLDAGGYGVLAAGSKNVLIDGLHFIAGDDGDATGYNGRHAVYISNNADGGMINTIVSGLLADYTAKTTLPPAAVNIRNSQRLLINKSIIDGTGIGGIRDTGNSDGTLINGVIVNQIKRSDGTASCITLGDDVVVSGTTYRNYNLGIVGSIIRMRALNDSVVINNNAWGIVVSGRHSLISSNLFDLPALVYPILVKAGANNVLITGNLDNSESGQAFVVFEGACSEVSFIGNRVIGRPLFRNIANCTNLRVDFPRTFDFVWTGSSTSAAVSNDTYTIFTSAAVSGSSILVTLANHITQDALNSIDYIFLGNDTVHPARVALAISSSSKTFNIRCYDSSGAVMATSAYNLALRFKFTC